LFYILKHYSLNEIISAFYKKFWKIISKNLILKSLIYFDDIEEQELIINNNIKFCDIKQNLEILVKNYD
jgi:ethanolamine utilization protein EutA (predicted chaperonin)